MHAHIEALNYERDARNCEAAKVPTVEVKQADGSFLEVALPYVWEVCPVCRGAGKHVNPAIDCGGITAEDFDADPEFREDYMAGAFDQTCNRCRGRTTVPAVDQSRLTPELRAALEERERDERAAHAERMAELRAGC